MKYCKKGEVRFNLKKEKDREENLQIFMIFNFNGNRLRYYTGKRIDKSKWDEEDQRVKKGYYEAEQINDHLKFLSGTIVQEFSKSKIKGDKINTEYLRRILKERENKIKSESLLDHFLKFLDVKKNEIAYNTYKKYKTAHGKLKGFEEETGYILNFESIDLDFEEKFRKYLMNNEGLTNNSIAKYFKIIKSFMNYASDKGLNTSQDYKKFKVRESEGDVIFLTWEELIKLKDHEFESKKHERVRDIFCFGCFTGLRFSDIQNLKPENVDKKFEYITIKTLKTRRDNKIPIIKFASEILKKYYDEESDRLFPLISNQKFNEYLKEVGEKAKIKEKIEVIKYRGAERIEKTIKKYDALTSHVARKTFITNALQRGMPTEVVMDVTGHNSYRAFKRYFKIVDKHKKEEMLKAFN